MFRLALKNTFARKLRLLSTSFAVMLGIAFLAGTLVFTDTIERTFDNLFAGIYENTDAVVRSETSIEAEMGWEMRGRIPESTLATVREVDGVAQAQGIVQGFAQIVGSDGDAIGNPGQGPPTFGQNYQSGELSPWEMIEPGRAPGPGEIVIDKRSADEGDLQLGDAVTVLTQTGPHELTLVGTVRFGSADSPGGASVSLFDLTTAQQVLAGASGQLDMVMVAAVEGISEDEIAARIAAAIPEDTEALTGTEITEETQADLQEMLSFVDTFLLAFAAIGLVVACFTIYNTFQIVVTQRRREMAMLRAVGATRHQVLSAQLLEAVFLGVLASLVGLAVGVFIAAALKGMLEAFGVDIPAGGTAFRTRTAVVALALGPLVTVVSAVFPSLRASRIPPLAALRDVAVGRVDRPSRRLLSGASVTVGGVAALVAGLGGSGLAWVGVGALAIFVGVFVLGPVIARPVVGVLGAPVSAVSGITGSLARENALRNPKRTARTGGALMVGVALVVAITVMSASMKDWTRDVFDEQFTGDFVVATEGAGFGGLSPQLASDLNELPEVDSAAGVRAGVARVHRARHERHHLRVGRSGDGRPSVRRRHDRRQHRGLDAERRPARRRRGGRPPPRCRRHARAHVPRRHDSGADRRGHLHGGDTGGAAGHQPRAQRAERQRAARRLRVHRQGGRGQRRRRRCRHRGGQRRVPERRAAEPRGVHRQPGREPGPVGQPHVRPARAGGDHRPVQHRQQRGAVDPRAHPRVGPAACGRDDPPADPRNRAVGGGPHRAARERARCTHRDLPRLVDQRRHPRRGSRPRSACRSPRSW